MNSTYHAGVHKFSLFVVCWTILLLIAGALVTSNEAALAVPDWPLSYGTLTPPMVGGIFYEHSHRVIAGGLGIFVLVLAMLLWRTDERRWLRWFGILAVLGVVAQAILGGQVVIRLLHYWLPVLHACFAQIVFAAVVSIAIFTSRWWVSERQQFDDKGTPSIHALAVINAVVIYLQVILGAGFRHQDIPVWPHIFGAFVVLGVVTYTAVVLRKRFDISKELSKARILLHAIFGTQFILGLAAYWSRLKTATAPQPMPVMVTLTVAHTVVGALLFATGVIVALLCFRLIPRTGEARTAVRGQVTI